jgi:hypothetical protein
VNFEDVNRPELEMYENTVSIVQKPAHGKLIPYRWGRPSATVLDYRYQPDTGFVGTDQTAWLVTGTDQRTGNPVSVSLTYSLRVTSETFADYLKDESRLRQKYCPRLYWPLVSHNTRALPPRTDVAPAVEMTGQ